MNFVTAAYYPVKCRSKESGTRNNQQCGFGRKQQSGARHQSEEGALALSGKYSQQLSTFTADNISVQLKSVLEVGRVASAT